MTRAHKPYKVRFTTEERFWRNVRKTDGCWAWTGSLDNKMYGRLSIGGASRLAHRLSYNIAHGVVLSKEVLLDHRCHPNDGSCPGALACMHRRCVNPAHLVITTHRENLLRGMTFQSRNAAKTECPKGHPYSHGNTLVYKGVNGPSRVCRTCNREGVAARRVADPEHRRALDRASYAKRRDRKKQLYHIEPEPLPDST